MITAQPSPGSPSQKLLTSSSEQEASITFQAWDKKTYGKNTFIRILPIDRTSCCVTSEKDLKIRFIVSIVSQGLCQRLNLCCSKNNYRSKEKIIECKIIDPADLDATILQINKNLSEAAKELFKGNEKNWADVLAKKINLATIVSSPHTHHKHKPSTSSHSTSKSSSTSSKAPAAMKLSKQHPTPESASPPLSIKTDQQQITTIDSPVPSPVAASSKTSTAASTAKNDSQSASSSSSSSSSTTFKPRQLPNILKAKMEARQAEVKDEEIPVCVLPTPVKPRPPVAREGKTKTRLVVAPEERLPLPGIPEVNDSISLREYMIASNPLEAQAKMADARNAARTAGETDPRDIPKNSEEKVKNPLLEFTIHECPGVKSVSLMKGHCAVAHAQGIRPTMEDEHLVDTFTFIGNKIPISVEVNAIFDGHGGGQCAKFAKKNLTNFLQHYLSSYCFNEVNDLNINRALTIALVNLSRSYPSLVAGCTANVRVKIGNVHWFPNIGDSRALWLKPDGTFEQLTLDQKTRTDEIHKEIRKRGGSVSARDRVDDVLLVGRSIGDHALRGHISARPKITMLEGNPKGWILQFCDGIPEVATSKQIAEFAYKELQKIQKTPSSKDEAKEESKDKRDPLEEVARKVVSKAFAAGSADNLSFMITALE